ncbi:uncharacterized protein LOC127877668 isoform X1 [Dreissena polymorpha]|uniref:uncharacterized protein LOC127877668 isoform X1 n=1 Tax=Dreissena polymorpha TaxID=45954 RepID=UPI002264B77D|nr:uncharacterized protein LOC127877668 isoform X1 [Dreissena polymorpha]
MKTILKSCFVAVLISGILGKVNLPEIETAYKNYDEDSDRAQTGWLKSCRRNSHLRDTSSLHNARLIKNDEASFNVDNVDDVRVSARGARDHSFSDARQYPQVNQMYDYTESADRRERKAPNDKNLKHITHSTASGKISTRNVLPNTVIDPKPPLYVQDRVSLLKIKADIENIESLLDNLDLGNRLSETEPPAGLHAHPATTPAATPAPLESTHSPITPPNYPESYKGYSPIYPTPTPSAASVIAPFVASPVTESNFTTPSHSKLSQRSIRRDKKLHDSTKDLIDARSRRQIRKLTSNLKRNSRQKKSNALKLVIGVEKKKSKQGSLISGIKEEIAQIKKLTLYLKKFIDKIVRKLSNRIEDKTLDHRADIKDNGERVSELQKTLSGQIDDIRYNVTMLMTAQKELAQTVGVLLTNSMDILKVEVAMLTQRTSKTAVPSAERGHVSNDNLGLEKGHKTEKQKVSNTAEAASSSTTVKHPTSAKHTDTSQEKLKSKSDDLAPPALNKSFQKASAENQGGKDTNVIGNTDKSPGHASGKNQGLDKAHAIQKPNESNKAKAENKSPGHASGKKQNLDTSQTAKKENKGNKAKEINKSSGYASGKIQGLDKAHATQKPNESNKAKAENKSPGHAYGKKQNLDTSQTAKKENKGNKAKEINKSSGYASGKIEGLDKAHATQKPNESNKAKAENKSTGHASGKKQNSETAKAAKKENTSNKAKEINKSPGYASGKNQGLEKAHATQKPNKSNKREISHPATLLAKSKI